MLDSWSEEKLSAQMAVAEIITRIITITQAGAKYNQRATPPSSVVVPSIWKHSARLLGLSAQVYNIVQNVQAEHQMEWF